MAWSDAITVGYVQAGIYVAQTIILAWTLRILSVQLKHLSAQVEMQRKDSVGSAAEKVFDQWWSDDIRKLRRYFFLEFIPLHLPLVAEKSLKEIQSIVSADGGRAAELCFFFDRIGWMGASGLIDVDYVLSPMQHTLRRVWVVMEPMIKRARASKFPHFDPVYLYGFEWLVLRTELHDCHQVDLLRRRFSSPAILAKGQAVELKKDILDDEDVYLRDVLEPIRKLSASVVQSDTPLNP